MPQKQLSARLQAARDKSGLSQVEAAKKWGVSLRSLQSWEQGVRQPRGLAAPALESILKKAGV